jgi:hypothetical protein
MQGGVEGAHLREVRSVHRQEGCEARAERELVK